MDCWRSSPRRRAPPPGRRRAQARPASARRRRRKSTVRASPVLTKRPRVAPVANGPERRPGPAGRHGGLPNHRCRRRRARAHNARHAAPQGTRRASQQGTHRDRRANRSRRREVRCEAERQRARATKRPPRSPRHGRVVGAKSFVTRRMPVPATGCVPLSSACPGDAAGDFVSKAHSASPRSFRGSRPVSRRGSLTPSRGPAQGRLCHWRWRCRHRRGLTPAPPYGTRARRRSEARTGSGRSR